MPGYVDLATLHTPAASGKPPAAWGLQVRDNFETLAKPPRVRVRRTTDMSIPTGVQTAISWTSVVRDLDYDGVSPHWTNTAPTRLTSRRTGTYEVGFGAFFNLNGSGQRQMGVRVNGAGERVLGYYGAGSAASFTGSAVSGEVDLNSGDFIEVVGFQDTGANLAVVAVLLPFFYMRWIGP